MDIQPPSDAELYVDIDLDFYAISGATSWLWSSKQNHWLLFKDPDCIRFYATDLTRVPTMPVTAS